MTTAVRSRDRDQLARRGVSVEEVERQLELLRSPPAPPRVLRPCGLEDGIVRIDPEREPELLAAWRRAAAAGRWGKFVPASGAASRMFAPLQALLAARREGGGEAASSAETRVRDLVRRAPELAFYEPWRNAVRSSGREWRELAEAGELAALVRCLLGPEGLGYGQLAKGLIPFHRYPRGSRTAFAEHLMEAARHLVDGGGECRVHFTVAESQRRAFELARERMTESAGARFAVSFSSQHPRTDTVALDREGRPFRRSNGELLFRPGGHGALLENLAEEGGDLVYVKNIDNVAHERLHGISSRWKRLLGGYLVLLEERLRGVGEEVAAAGESAAAAVERGLRLLRSELALRPPAELAEASLERRRAYLVDRLQRPVRVCGMVRNQGEPGGGPFWVEQAGGEASGQIVEAAQLAASSADRRRLLQGATHFNPVDLACSLRDGSGRPFDLDRFVDPTTAMVARKNHDGRRLLALERPGLWNGSMAGWNTVFVEVPAETFSPVKTVFDLLRAEHLPAAD